MNQQSLLERVVENAMDFLNRSIDEFSEHPKFSVIHFHAAVEIFLKACLMAEHWSLILSRPENADWDNFVEGNFVSVTLDEAVNRLNKIVRSGFSGREEQILKRLNAHRNKFVHFTHKSVFTYENDEKLRREIAKQQLTAWHFLHKALTERWSNVFSPWINDLKKIDIELRKLQDYLQVVFDHQKPKLKLLKEQGVEIGKCPSCGFPSQEYSNEIEVAYESGCHVCGLTEICFNFKCPNCETLISFINEGFGRCESCNHEYEPNTLAEAVNDHREAYLAFKEGDDEWQLGNCSDCDQYHTVVRLRNYEWMYFCTSCFGQFDSLYICGYCNEPNTHKTEDSYWTGCGFCSGKGFD